jgi:hypothetical protein
MKKITVILLLVTVSFGYSQTFPIDFEDTLDSNMIGADGATFNIITDPDTPAENVGEVTVAGQLYSNIQIDLAENLDLSNDANNTITFRFKPQNGTGSNSHLLKFELGPAGANTELPFTTDGTTNWQNISVNFGSGLTNYSRLVIFPDFNNTMIDTYLIDDIAGGTNVPPPPASEAILPIDFSDSFELFVGQGAVTSLTTDPVDVNNDVMQVTSGGALYDNAQLELAQNVDLSDIGNNTITFRINPINGTGSNNHLLKFESAGFGDPTVEVGFTTTGTGWQNISLDFDDDVNTNPGNYGKIVLFTDFNNTMQDTYLIDDIAGGTNVAPIVPPSSPAPNPTTPSANVFNIYSDTGGYTGGFNYGGGCFGALGDELDLDSGSGSNLTWEFDFGAQGFGCTNSTTVDVSTIGGLPIAYVSFQYYTDNATDFYIDLISGPGGSTVESFYYIGTNSAGDAPAEDIAIVQGSWQHVVIDISEFTNQTFDPTELFQFKFDVWSVQGPSTVFIDNVILSSLMPTLGAYDYELSQVIAYPNPTNNVWNIRSNSQNIKSVVVYDVLGKQVFALQPKSDKVEINSEKLSKGIYIAKIQTNYGESSLRLVKN